MPVLVHPHCGAVVLPEDNHGPVRVAGTYHFAYEDGSRYIPVGTTCYVWNLQSAALQEETLKTLAASPFNKIRFCIFPKHYIYNFNEPISYPYEGTPCDSSVLTKDNFKEFQGKAPGNNFNYKKLNPLHFQLIEENIQKLEKLGIEADIIVMHPYDRWGFSTMSKEEDDLYWHYVIARFASYHNVWWSLANEFDLMREKSIADWERYASILCEHDPYAHLRSIHNCHAFYDHKRPWITHCSIQRTDNYRTAEYTDAWRQQYGKPVVLDEIAYEGNIPNTWGNISGKELTRRFWEAALRGGYAQHSETYISDDDILWWSHGGILKGDSPERIAFLKDILSQAPGLGLTRFNNPSIPVCGVVEGVEPPQTQAKIYYLCYFGNNRPTSVRFAIDEDTAYQVDVIDTWEMTIQDCGVHNGAFEIALPGKEYIAVRLRRK